MPWMFRAKNTTSKVQFLLPHKSTANWAYTEQQWHPMAFSLTLGHNSLGGESKGSIPSVDVVASTPITYQSNSSRSWAAER